MHDEIMLTRLMRLRVTIANHNGCSAAEPSVYDDHGALNAYAAAL